MIPGLAERLQKLRKSKNISQKQLANALGLSTSVISNYEAEERTPSVENLIAIAKFYHCSVDFLLGLEKENSVNILDVSGLDEKQTTLLQNFISSLK